MCRVEFEEKKKIYWNEFKKQPTANTADIAHQGGSKIEGLIYYTVITVFIFN